RRVTTNRPVGVEPSEDGSEPRQRWLTTTPPGQRITAFASSELIGAASSTRRKRRRCQPQQPSTAGQSKVPRVLGPASHHDTGYMRAASGSRDTRACAGEGARAACRAGGTPSDRSIVWLPPGDCGAEPVGSVRSSDERSSGLAGGAALWTTELCVRR